MTAPPQMEQADQNASGVDGERRRHGFDGERRDGGKYRLRNWR